MAEAQELRVDERAADRERAYRAGRAAMRDGSRIGEAGPAVVQLAPGLKILDMAALEQAWRDGWLDELATKVRAIESKDARVLDYLATGALPGGAAP